MGILNDILNKLRGKPATTATPTTQVLKDVDVEAVLAQMPAR